LTTKFTQHTRVSRRESTGNFHVAIACSSLRLTTEHQQAALIKLTLALLIAFTCDQKLVITQCYSVVKHRRPCGLPPGWLGRNCPKFGAKRLRLFNRYS
jgi:hypothetical protein